MKRLPCSWIRRVRIIIAVLLKRIYQFSTVFIRILTTCFVEIQTDPKIIWKLKEAQIANIYILTKNKFETQFSISELQTNNNHDRFVLP